MYLFYFSATLGLFVKIEQMLTGMFEKIQSAAHLLREERQRDKAVQFEQLCNCIVKYTGSRRINFENDPMRCEISRVSGEVYIALV